MALKFLFSGVGRYIDTSLVQQYWSYNNPSEFASQQPRNSQKQKEQQSPLQEELLMDQQNPINDQSMALPSLGEVWFTTLPSDGSDANVNDPPDVSDNLCSAGKRNFESMVGGDIDPLPFVPDLDLREAHPGFSTAQKQPTKDDISQPTTILDAALATQSLAVQNGDQETSKKPRKRRRNLSENQRIHRNVKEQERSNQVTGQFNELRDLLSRSGIVIPKGTKSAVLGISIDYIRALQEQQKQTERHNQQMVQQIQEMAQGRNGDQMARAVQQVGTTNNVWELPSLGGSQTNAQVSSEHAHYSKSEEASTPKGGVQYGALFDATPVPMAIASLGGSLMDCNRTFLDLANSSKEELKSLTIFNLIARAELQGSFQRISTMLLTKDENPHQDDEPFFVGASFTHRPDLSLQITPVRSADGEMQYLCVTLMQNETVAPIQAVVSPLPTDFSVIESQTTSGDSKDASQETLQAITAFRVIG